jgi:transmembrane sensor
MNSEEQKTDYSTLLRYFENKATREEATLITEWLESNEESFKCENCMRLLWDELDPEAKESDMDLEPLLDRIHHSIRLKSAKGTKKTSTRKERRPGRSYNHVLRNLGRVAAILLLPFMGYIAWEIYSQKMWVKSQAEVTYQDIYCPLAAISIFELPDGTRGYLNNGSTIKHPGKFTGDTREIFLYGEAFFDVKHDRQRPFIIRTDGLDVKVLGTQVNILSYPDENYQEITLVSGSVELIQQEEGQELIITEMKPGQHAVYRFDDERAEAFAKSKDNDLVIVKNKKQINTVVSQLKPGKQALLSMDKGDLYLKNDDTERYIGWKDGKLVLRNDPMPVLLKRIERWYSVEFNIMDERINEYTYWATFMEESLDQVLMRLALTGPVKFNMLPREIVDGTPERQQINVYIERK